MNEKAMPRFLTLFSLLLALALGACSGREAPPLEGASLQNRFALTDQDGRRVSDRDFVGQYRIVYFGFAHCPDVCPVDLVLLSQALRRFEKSAPDRAARAKPIFVTVDPERDTPAELKTYAEAFHPGLVALTGSADEIAAAAKAHGIYYAKGAAQPGGAYSMDHSRLFLLFGPEGEPIAILPHDRGVDGLVSELERWIE